MRWRRASQLRGGRAAGVHFIDAGRESYAEATREVVLCGGVFNSPQLLMLSGIGPADQLRALGITPLADLPVGRNLRDHLAVSLRWRRREPGPFQRQMRLDRVALAMARAWLLRDGPATTLPLGLIAFLKSMPDWRRPISNSCSGHRRSRLGHGCRGCGLPHRTSWACGRCCCIRAAAGR